MQESFGDCPPTLGDYQHRARQPIFQEGGCRLQGEAAAEPLFSIITIVFNAKDHLEKTIQSAIAQTQSPTIYWEHIIIDGGSTDGTLEVIRAYSKHISYWLSEPDLGISDAFNKGLARARGRWINFLNAGDCYARPDTLQEVAKVAANSKQKIISGFSWMVDRNHRLPKRTLSNADPLSVRAMISHQASFVARSLFAEIGLFSLGYQIRMDYDFWLRALARHEFLMVDRVWVLYDPNGISTRRESIVTFFAEERKANRLNDVPSYHAINLWLRLKAYLKLLWSYFQDRHHAISSRAQIFSDLVHF